MYGVTVARMETKKKEKENGKENRQKPSVFTPHAP